MYNDCCGLQHDQGTARHGTQTPPGQEPGDTGPTSTTQTQSFFLRLPYGQYGPVSQLSWSEKSCTGPFNWSEAHCAGKNVKRRIGPFQRKSLTNQTRTTTQQRGAARHGNQEPPSQASRGAEKTNHHKQETLQTDLGRLNVHRNALNNALIQ